MFPPFSSRPDLHSLTLTAQHVLSFSHFLPWWEMRILSCFQNGILAQGQAYLRLHCPLLKPDWHTMLQLDNSWPTYFVWCLCMCCRVENVKQALQLWFGHKYPVIPVCHRMCTFFYMHKTNSSTSSTAAKLKHLAMKYSSGPRAVWSTGTTNN